MIPSGPELPTQYTKSGNRNDRRYRWAIAVAILLGFAVRFIHVGRFDFPLNDGGMFYVMARELMASHFSLPAFTSYNTIGAPFAYSPLAFYFVAAVAIVLPVSVEMLFRIVPALIASCCVAAFALAAQTMLSYELGTTPNIDSPAGATETDTSNQIRDIVVAAVVAFALVPRSFIWLIMGGGLTRSFGFLFAILALWQIYTFYTTGEWKRAVIATLFCALTVLSHLGTAPFVAFSAALFLVARGRNRTALLGSLAIGAGTLLLTAPWWLTVIHTHGIAPYIAANATGGSVFNERTRGQVLGALLHFGLGTGEPLLPLIGLLGLGGAIITVRRRQYLLAIWWVEILLLDARAGGTYATIPIAMLAGVAVVWLARFRTPALLAAIPLSAYAMFGALTVNPRLSREGRFLVSLSPSDRAAMKWVSANTPASDSVLVITGTAVGGWWADRVSEWFPVLAQRHSAATVQATEWLPNEMFARMESAYDNVQACGISKTACLDGWSAATGIPFTDVYVPKLPNGACCASLVASLRSDPRYALAYDGPGALLFVRRTNISHSRDTTRIGQ